MRFTANRSRIASGASAAALAFVLAGSPLLAGAAFAQEQAQQETAKSGGIEEIVVTATRTATNLQDTPIAITAVTAQALEERSFTSIQDVGAIVPNASFKQAQAAFGRAVTAYIRGIGQNDFNLAFEPGVAFYVDDQYYALLAGSTFDLLDLERVEVMRGPQGTLFGRNAIGGAVNLIPKAPNADPSGYIEATYGSYNRTDIRAGFNYPLSENLFLRVGGVSKSRKGYQKLLDFRCQMFKEGTPALAGDFPSLDPSNGNFGGAVRDNCVIDRYGGEDVRALRAAIRYEGSGVDITLSADYTNDQSKVAADTLIRLLPTGYSSAGAPNARQIDINGDSTLDVYVADANADGIADGGTARLDQLVYQPLFGVSYDSRFLRTNRFETFATYADPVPAGYSTGAAPTNTYYTGAGNRGGAQLDRTSVIENYGFNGKAIFELADSLTATVIAGYRNVFTTGINDPDGSPLGVQTIKTQITHEQWTVEPRINYTSDLFDLTVGAFYYNADSITTSNVSIPFIPLQQNAYITFANESKAAFGQAVVRPIEKLSLTLGGRYSEDTKDVLFNNSVFIRPVNVKGDSFDWRLGADYQVTDDITVYASAATGYRPGAFNPRPFQVSQLVPVDGEEMTGYELGFKGDLFDRRLRLNIAGFYSDYKQRITPAGGAECLDNGTSGQCILPGSQVEVSNNQGGSTCRALLPGEVPNLAAGIGVVCIPKTNYINSPGKVKGVEVELEARPIDGLMINFTGGYTKFKAPELQANPLVVNKTPVYVPEWTASGGIAYDIPVAALTGTITPRLDWFYQSEISYNSGSAFASTPGYSTFNGRITYANEDGDWQLALGATNLFNKKYYLNIFDLVPFGQPTSSGQPGAPRQWYLQVKKRF